MSAAQKRGADDDDELFHYSNTMELTFGKKRRLMNSDQQPLGRMTCRPVGESSSSSSDSEEETSRWKQIELISGDDDDDDDGNDDDDDDVIICNGEKMVVKELKGDSLERNTPSPPPPPKCQTGLGKVSRNTAASLKALNNVKRLLIEEAYQTASPIQHRSAANDVVLIDESPVNREMTLKVKCHGIVNRYKIRQYEPFANIINSIAKKENTTGEKVLLYHGENSIRQQDTPLTVGCSVADILECVIVSEKQHESFSTEDDIDDEGKIKIKIQTKENHSKQEYLICKMSPLEEVVKKYCDQRKIPFAGVKIFFDGEEVNLTDTAQTLDMENDDMIDLKHN